ncbi:MAG: carboxypeptidase regulatory-like domain-containing protein, partial [Candidatus Omnitrophica bacterium]|nr:carboxypeptidase regulatory-like domain-containing protein [Candidatus Omnitrophota bacterium]
MPKEDVRIINPFLIGVALLVVVAGVGVALWLALGESPKPKSEKELIRVVHEEESPEEQPQEAEKPIEEETSQAEEGGDKEYVGASPSRVWGKVVRAEDQSPIGDVEVLAAKSPNSKPLRLTTKSDGEFRFDDLAEGEWHFIADASGMADVHSKEYFGRAEVTPGAKIDNVVLQVVKPATLEGKVETFIGKPVADAVIQVFAGWNLKGQPVASSPWGGKKDRNDALSHEYFTEAVSDQEGHFRIGGLEQGTYDLVANGKGFARQVQLGVPTGTDEAVFRLEPEVRIEGTVSLSTDRQPVEGATVTVEFDAPGFPQFSGSILTSASGKYVITGLPRKSKMKIQAVSGEIESAPYNRTFLGQAGAQTRDLLIIPNRRIFGRVINSHTKMAVSGIEVWNENRLGTSLAANTQPDGQFSFETGIAVHKIQFRKPGEYRETDWIEVIFKEAEREYEVGPIEMVEGLTLEGKVSDSKTRLPIQGAIVRAIPADQKVLDLKDLPSAETDSAGRFLLEGVPRGTHFVSAEKFGYTPGYAKPLEAGEESTGRKPIEVEPPGPLEGFEISLTKTPTVSVGGTV